MVVTTSSQLNQPPEHASKFHPTRVFRLILVANLLLPLQFPRKSNELMILRFQHFKFKSKCTFFTISDIVSKTREFSCTLRPTLITRSRSSSTSVSSKIDKKFKWNISDSFFCFQMKKKVSASVIPSVTIPNRTQIKPSEPSPNENALSVARSASTKSVFSLFNSVLA